MSETSTTATSPKVSHYHCTQNALIFLSLLFWGFLACLPFKELLVFWLVFPFFSRDFWGSEEMENPCFFLVVFLAFSRKEQGKEDQGDYRTELCYFWIISVTCALWLPNRLVSGITWSSGRSVSRGLPNPWPNCFGSSVRIFWWRNYRTKIVLEWIR